MAPQNSTLLHESSELVKVFGHYSPIARNRCENLGDDDDNTSSYSANTDVHDVVGRKKSITELRQPLDDEVDDEIAIWICGEPRFVSGITENTTCNDLIDALIEDELNGNKVDVAASRDLNDYVITEKWRDVEQALPANTKILPILMAWGNARHEVKFKLKINKNKAGTILVDDYNNSSDDANHDDKRYKQMGERRTRKKSEELTALMKRLINQGESIKEQLTFLKTKQNSSRSTSSGVVKHHDIQPRSQELPHKSYYPLQEQKSLLLQHTQQYQELQQICLPSEPESQRQAIFQTQSKPQVEIEPEAIKAEIHLPIQAKSKPDTRSEPQFKSELLIGPELHIKSKHNIKSDLHIKPKLQNNIKLHTEAKPHAKVELPVEVRPNDKTELPTDTKTRNRPELQNKPESSIKPAPHNRPEHQSKVEPYIKPKPFTYLEPQIKFQQHPQQSQQIQQPQQMSAHLMQLQHHRPVTTLLQSLINSGQTKEQRPPLPPKSLKLQRPTPCSPEKSLVKTADVVTKAEPAVAILDDELFLVFDNDNKSASFNENDRSMGNVHVEYRQYCLNKKLDMAIAAAKATRENSTNTSSTGHANADILPPRRSISRKLEFDVHRQNSFNKRLIKYLGENIRQRYGNLVSMTADPQASIDGINVIIHNQMDGIIEEIRELVRCEEELIQVYTDKCERYRSHNNKYKTKYRLELCVDEVQRTLEMYAKEIIDSELKLYRIQNDIHEKCSRLYELQNSLSHNVMDASREHNRSKNAHENSAKYSDNNKFDDSGAFVDSITDKTFII